jgi:HlyD family secretion protein
MQWWDLLLQFREYLGETRLRLPSQTMANGRKTKTGLGIFAGVVILLAVAGIVGRRKPPLIQVAMVTRQDLNAVVTSNGKVEPIDATIAHAEFPTFVQSVSAMEGQAVHRGQVVLTLDAADLRGQLAQARVNLLAAEADFRNARAGGPPDSVAQAQGDLDKARINVSNLERRQTTLKELVAKHAATQDELDQNADLLAAANASLKVAQQRRDELARLAPGDADSATLRVQQAKDQIRALEEKLRSATVIAPADDILYSLPVRVGDYVTVGGALASMADLRRVRVRAYVDEPDLGWLAANQVVEITWDAKPGKTWQGRTELAPKQVVPLGNRSVGEVYCSVDNAALDLVPNVNVEVRILVRQSRQALSVPRAAVRTDDQTRYVYLLSDNRLQRRDVSVGIASSTRDEILSGLAEGDRVALQGDLALRNGMVIRPRDIP